MKLKSILNVKAYFTALLVVLTVVNVSDATAQETAVAEDQDFVIEEVIVTARKREESLQEVPISISVFSADDLEMRSLQDLSQIAPFTPNLEIGLASGGNGASSSSVVYIRGIGQEDYMITTDVGVGLYVDGVYFGRSIGAVLDLVDLERVEVLKGPQGTLFGKNTIGGAINVVTVKPDMEFSGRAELGVGRFDEFNAKFNINLPLVQDTLAARFSFSSRNRDGYLKRVHTGDDQGDVNSDAVRGQILWTPSETFEALLAADYTRQREKSAATTLVAAFPSGLGGLYNATVAIPVYGEPFGANQLTGNPFESFGTGPNKNDVNAGGVSLTMNWDLGMGIFKSISAYRETTAILESDQDNSPLPYLEFLIDDDQNQFSQEFQFTGSFLDDRFNLVTGVYYLDETATNVLDATVAEGLLGVIGIEIGSVGVNEVKNKSYAAYSQGSYNLTDKLSATVGIRYTYEKKDRSHRTFKKRQGVEPIPLVETDGNWGAFSPRFSLEYQVNDDLMTYVSAARGFKSGGFNARPSNTASAIAPYDPEFVWAYELGVRSEWFQKRLRLNATTFYNDYTDIQTTASNVTDQGDIIIVTENAAKAKVKGFELEVVAQPTANFRLDAAVGYLDAKYTEVSPQSTVITQDTKFLKAPKWSVAVGAQFTAPIKNIGNITLRGDYAYTAKTYNEQNNHPTAAQDGFSLLNARLAFVDREDIWEIALAVTNITDKAYLVNGRYSAGLGLTGGTYAPPRLWRLTLTRRF